MGVTIFEDILTSIKSTCDELIQAGMNDNPSSM